VAVARIGHGWTTPDYTTVESIYLSTDAGASWTPTSVSPEDDGRSSEYVRKLAFDRAAPQGIYAAVSSGALTHRGWIRSTDGGASWNVAMDGIGGVAVLVVARGPGGITWVRRAGACGLWKLASGAWTTPGCDRSGRYTVGEFMVHQATGWLHEAGYWTSSDTQDPEYYRSSDQGASWLQPWVTQSGLFVRPLALATDHGTGARVYAWYQVDWGDTELHRSDNGLDAGMGFQPPLPSFPAAAAVVDPGDDTRLFAVDGDTGEVHLSTDAGVTWASRSAGLPSAAAIDLFMDPAAPARLAVVYETAGVFRSDDAGATWAAVPVDTGGSEVVGADWDPAGDRVFLATKDRGAWIPGTGLVTAGLTSRRLTSILYEPATGEVLVGTEYASVWRMDPADPTTAPALAESPGGLRLHAQPNPFRGEVRFSLAAPPGASLDLAIHDVAGRRVAAPALGRGGAAIWDGTDLSGNPVAAGVYFARLRAGDEQVSRRIVRLGR
jgi:hypothetical protein